jgi:hypothetical protein
MKRTDRDAEGIRRGKIPSIRDVQSNVNLQETAATRYLQVGASPISFGKYWSGAPSSITFVNTSATCAPTLDLSITRVTTPTTVYLLKNVTVPVGSTLVLNKEDIAVEEGVTGYTIQLTHATIPPTMDVRIKI